jgi:hypothetical protein
MGAVTGATRYHGRDIECLEVADERQGSFAAH